jgi:hypothetical protein
LNTNPGFSKCAFQIQPADGHYNLLTQQLVDDITQRRTATHKECVAQGLGNIANGAGLYKPNAVAP